MRQFAFRLCLALGVVHPDYLLRQINSYQLAEWMAYFQIHPFGQLESDRVVARVGASICHHLAKSTIEAKDFLPQRQQTPEEVEEALETLFGDS